MKNVACKDGVKGFRRRNGRGAYRNIQQALLVPVASNQIFIHFYLLSVRFVQPGHKSCEILTISLVFRFL